MQDYMMIFRYEPNNDYKPSQEEMDAHRQKWQSFIGGLVAQDKFVRTNQLGQTGKVMSPGFKVADGTHFANNQMVGGNMVVKADSMEEALEMSKGSPILDLGGTVEVRDIIPMG